MEVDDHQKKLKQSVRLKDFPPHHSLNAYKLGFYFEAVTVLHGYTESRMRELFHLHATKISRKPLGLTWDVNERLSYIALAHVLFVLQFIDKTEYNVLTGFNAMRNELIHKHFHEPYDDFYYGVSKKKLASCYKQTLKITDKIERKSEGLL